MRLQPGANQLRPSELEQKPKPTSTGCRADGGKRTLPAGSGTAVGDAWLAGRVGPAVRVLNSAWEGGLQ